MKPLLRNTSSHIFMTLGGLLSNRQLPQELNVTVPPRLERERYRTESRAFGTLESNVENYLIDLLRDELGWSSAEKKHDILCNHNGDRLLIECKRHDSTLLYLEDHNGGNDQETPVEELQRNLKEFDCKWGILTDGVTFRLYYAEHVEPTLSEHYLEVSLGDISDSSIACPYELKLLIDILSPGSVTRSINPAERHGIPDEYLNKILRVANANKKGLHTILKSFFVAALEDMGVRPLHTGMEQSIKTAKKEKEFQKIFKSILTNDPDFHKSSDFISNKLCRSIHKLFQELSDIDFAHVDHEFLGIVYQKFICNGNASHYTNSSLSKELATYLADLSGKSQTNPRRRALGENDYIIDPAVGSGQLLRTLLPFHKVFFLGRTKGIDGWRALATHFLGRDIDAEAIWVAKLNIWLSTAKKGDSLVDLSGAFVPIDVIHETITRQAGKSIKQAIKVPDEQNIVACISNPPWDRFKGDARRSRTFNSRLVEQIQRSLSLQNVRNVNRAQIFLRIIAMLGEEEQRMRFAVVLPDSFFIDQNDAMRASVVPNIDYYFSYPKNWDAVAGKRIFEDVDNVQKFGIIFGRSNTTFESPICYPLGKDTRIVITQRLRTIGDNTALPLFSHPVQAAIIEGWNQRRTRTPSWGQGEFNTTLWANTDDRTESDRGRHRVVSGSSFCVEGHAWSRHTPDPNTFWRRFSSVSSLDEEKKSRNRTLFSDYINNSAKLNNSSFLPADTDVNITNSVLYSFDCLPNDYLIYDSPVFTALVECYGGSLHFSAWRLNAVGLPNPIRATTHLAAGAELAVQLGLSVDQCRELYRVYSSWLNLEESETAWIQMVQQQIAGVQPQAAAVRIIDEATIETGSEVGNRTNSSEDDT